MLECGFSKPAKERIAQMQSAGKNDATIIQGIDFAITNGARVISMSLGSDGSFDPAFSNAITTAQANDIVVTVSAGNKAKDNDAAGGAAHYPCNFTQPNLVCVAALSATP